MNLIPRRLQELADERSNPKTFAITIVIYYPDGSETFEKFIGFDAARDWLSVKELEQADDEDHGLGEIGL